MELRGIKVGKALREFNSLRSILTAINGIALSGTSKTSLELIRLQKMLQVKEKMRKRFQKDLQITNLDETMQRPGKYVWVYWDKDLEFAPKAVQMAVKSIVKEFGEERVRLLSDDNLRDVVDIPESIISKKEKGIISAAFFSDLLRLNILIEHGGLWLDATTLVSEGAKSTPVLKEILDSKLFFFQNMRPGQMGNAIFLSSWLINSWTNDPTMVALRRVLYKYVNRLKKPGQMDDYFMFHIFWHLIFETNEGYLDKVVKIPNSLPLMLLYRLEADFDENEVINIFNKMPIQKITYKNYDKSSNDSVIRTLVRLSEN